MRRLITSPYKVFFTAFIILLFSFVFTTTIQAVITTPLSGSYTIKADGSGDFISLKEAADTYNTYGLSGNTTLIIGSDLIETAFAEFKGTASNSQTYILTLTSDNTVQRKVSGAINGPLVKLTGANNIIIDGIVPVTESTPTAPLLLFTNTFATAGTSVRTLSVEKDGASSGQNVRIRNTEFSMANQQRGPGGGTVIYFATDSVWVNKCYVHNGYSGIYGDLSKFVQIQDNIVSQNHANGIYTELSTVAVNTTISRNIVKDMTPTSGSRQKLNGIYVVHNAGSGTCDLLYNRIDNLNNQAGFECSTYPLYIYSAATINVIGNKVSNAYNNSVSSGFALQGMYILANSTNTVQCLNDTVINLTSESYAPGIYIRSFSFMPSLVKNCVVSNLNGKGVRPDFYSVVGIYAYGAINLDANKVDNIKNVADDARASAVGIYLDAISLTSGFISNNMVSDVAGRVGIGISAIGYANLYHNSVRLLSKFNDTDEATLINIGDRLSTNTAIIRFQNNLLSHEVPNGLAQNFVIKQQIASSVTNFANSNNRYHADNANIGMIVSDRAAQTGTIYPTLSGWAAASTDNSLMVLQPAFTTINNLHLSVFPYSLQVPLNGITTDFDGDLRTPCGNTAGADINPAGQGPLNGTYRIGNAPTDHFNSLKQAADVYNSCGLAGNTTFIIDSDLIETATAQFVGTAPGSDTWPLRITSDGVQRTVSGNINGSLVEFISANNITIDGGVAANAGLIDGGTNNTLLIFNNTNLGVNIVALGVHRFSPTVEGKNIVISNATFSTASTTGSNKGIFISTTQSVTQLSGCYITNATFGILMSEVFKGTYDSNVIRTVGGYGIFDLANMAPVIDLHITNNNIKGISFSTSEAQLAGIAVLAAAGTGNLFIDHNKISSIENLYSSGNVNNITASGIWIYFSGNSSSSGNQISNINNGYGAYSSGIYTQGVPANSTGYLLMANNMIFDIKGKTGYGIYAGQTLLNQRIYQNTISLSGSGLSTSKTINIGFGRTSSNDLRIRNNILVNTDMTGTASLFDGSEVHVGDNVFLDNKYKVSSEIIGALAGTTYNDLNTWNAHTGDNSLLADPAFVSASDLHLASASQTDYTLMSPYLTEVPTDIDGDSRTYCSNTAGIDNTNMQFLVKTASITNAACPGGNITITVNEFGGRAPYKYSLDGGTNYYDVSSVVNNVITIEAASPADGTYYLTIKDYDNCTSTAADELVVLNPVIIQTISGPDNLCANANVTYVTESGMSNYVWTLGGATLVSGGSSTDNTVTVKWTSSGSKTISVNYTNGNGCTAPTATTKTITVNPATAITTQPSISAAIKLPNGYIIPGSNIVLGVTATGNNLTYQWYKDVSGTVTTLTNTGKYSGATSSQLTISNAYETENGDYYIIVTGTCGTATSTPVTVVTVANQDASLKDLQVNGTTVDEFNPARINYMMTISCDVESVSLLGIPNNAGASVTGNGTFALQPGDNYFAIKVVAQDMVTTMTYTVNVVRGCYVPKIKKDLDDAVICLNGTHTWTIEAEGENLTYEWYKGEKRIIGQNSPSITFTNAQFSDYDRYYVIVRSNHNDFKSSVQSKKVRLWVADYLPEQLRLSEYPNPATVGKTSPIKVDGYIDVTKYIWSYSKDGVTFSPAVTLYNENETWATFGTLSAGTGVLKVTMEHPCGTRELTQSITVNYPTGVEDVTATVVSVYPNPTSGILKVSGTVANQMIRITDIAGSLKGSYKTQDGTTTIDLTGYTKGVYLLQYNGKAYKAIKK